jgi:bacterioferritin
MAELDQDKVIATLKRILEQELAAVVRYTHYSFMVFGHSRIPIVSWLRGEANEALLHAQEAGEWITSLGGYPSLSLGQLLDSHQHDIGAILRESLDAEWRRFRSTASCSIWSRIVRSRWRNTRGA